MICQNNLDLQLTFKVTRYINYKYYKLNANSTTIIKAKETSLRESTQHTKKEHASNEELQQIEKIIHSFESGQEVKANFGKISIVQGGEMKEYSKQTNSEEFEKKWNLYSSHMEMIEMSTTTKHERVYEDEHRRYGPVITIVDCTVYKKQYSFLGTAVTDFAKRCIDSVVDTNDDGMRSNSSYFPKMDEL